jgi:hypothetical protein
VKEEDSLDPGTEPFLDRNGSKINEPGLKSTYVPLLRRDRETHKNFEKNVVFLSL